MKYDRNTMKSLQEAYESVSEDKFYSGKDRDPNTGLPKGLKPEKAKKVKTKKAKKPNYEGSTAGSDVNDLKDSYFPEEQEHEGMKYSDKKKLERQEQLKKASKKAPVVKNKIVPTKKRVDEAIEMSRKEYNKIHKDFKGEIDKDGNAYVVVGQDTPTGNRVTRRRQYKITNNKPTNDAVKNESVEKNCGCGQIPCKTYGNVNEKKKEMDDKMKEVDDMRSLPTRMNLIKTKLRAMGLNMSHELKGKELSEVINYAVSHYISEEGYDHYRDNILMKGGDHRSKETRERSNTPSEQPKGQTAAQKDAKGKSALELVKADITKKHGKGAIMDVKKKRKD